MYGALFSAHSKVHRLFAASRSMSIVYCSCTDSGDSFLALLSSVSLLLRWMHNLLLVIFSASKTFLYTGCTACSSAFLAFKCSLSFGYYILESCPFFLCKVKASRYLQVLVSECRVIIQILLVLLLCWAPKYSTKSSTAGLPYFYIKIQQPSQFTA